MALNKTTLASLMASAVAAKIVSNGGPLTNPADLFDALADAVVNHLTTSGEVDTTGGLLLAPPGGGPCTGTAKIK
jgi:hypothetical protein